MCTVPEFIARSDVKFRSAQNLLHYSSLYRWGCQVAIHFGNLATELDGFEQKRHNSTLTLLHTYGIVSHTS